MKCDKCNEILDFRKMRTQNYLETGQIAIEMWLIIEEWPSEHERFFVTRREIRALSSDENYADRYVKVLENYYHEKYIKNKRPKVRKEVTYLDHLYAFSMDTYMSKGRNIELDTLIMKSDRDWISQIGEVEITHPPTDKLVMKVLLKYGQQNKEFSAYRFAEIFEFDVEQVQRVVNELLGVQIRYKRTNEEILNEEGKL